MSKEIQVTDEFLNSVGHTRETYNLLSRSGKWSVRNRKRHRELTKLWELNNPARRRELTRRSYLFRQYNITQEHYDALLAKQQYCCAICGTTKPTGKWKIFAVDHDHTTNEIRGLLCNECNRGMGLLKDNSELLIKAANYLDSHKAKTATERKERKK